MPRSPTRPRLAGEVEQAAGRTRADALQSAFSRPGPERRVVVTMLRHGWIIVMVVLLLWVSSTKASSQRGEPFFGALT
jgi:hypothetical protein